MSERRRASVTDAELNRVLRVARKHGAGAVEVKTAEAQFTIMLTGGENSGEIRPATVVKPRRKML